MSRKLGPGSEIAIIGGGPAGSFFAHYILRYSQEAGLDLRVTIYEAKSFANKGPKGCNRCAGVLSPRFVRDLREELGIELPTTVIQNRISSYRLHSPYGVVDVSNPDTELDALSIYRGGGPRLSSFEGPVSFDDYLLKEVEHRGAKVVLKRVEQVAIRPRPTVLVDGETREYDLLVLACGVNSPIVRPVYSNFSPPATRMMVQDELFAGEEAVQATLGSCAHIFIFPKSDLIFGSLVPKGAFINVSLLSRSDRLLRIDEFLAHELVRRVLPADYRKACGCQAIAAVGPAKNPYGDGFVGIGDVSVTRLYKDGLRSALLTAREAARTAVFHGISYADFHQHYSPIGHAIARDNYFGHILFNIHHRTKNSATFLTAQERLIASEQGLPQSEQIFSRVMWGVFSGNYDYGQILRMGFSPRYAGRLISAMIREKATRLVAGIAGVIFRKP